MIYIFICIFAKEIQIVTVFEKWYWMIKKCSYFIVTASAIALITMAFKGVDGGVKESLASNEQFFI